MSRRIINGTTDSQFTLWDLPIVGEGEPPVTVINAETMLPTAEDIETMQQQASKEAYDEAYAKAYAEGLEVGKKEGQQQGITAGKAEGYAEGIKQGSAVTEENNAQLKSIITSLTVPLAELDDTVEKELVFLAMTTARHLIRRELKVEPTHVIAAVRQAVELLPISAQKIKNYLNPEDAILVREALSVSDDEEQRWKIVEDPIVSRGGCNVESEYSRIDATIESRINSVIAQILGDERESASQDVALHESQ